MHLHHVRVKGVIAPHLAQQLRLREDQATVSDEERQQAELGRRQCERLPFPKRQPCLLVDEDVAGLEGCGVATGTPQHDPDASEQLLEGEWFDEIVVGPDLEAGQSVTDGIPSGQEHDRDIAPGTQPARELETISAWQADIEDDEVRHGRLDCLDLDEIGEGCDGQALTFERRADRGAYRRLVLDHHDARAFLHLPSIAPLAEQLLKIPPLQPQFSHDGDRGSRSHYARPHTSQPGRRSTMIDDPGRVRRLLVLAAAAVALVAVSGGSVVLAGNNGTKPSSSNLAATTAPATATTAPATGQSNPFDAAVQALVEDGTINQAQADVLRQQIDAGTIEPLVESGVLTAAQLQAVETRLGAVKQSLGAAARGASPSASTSTSNTAPKEAADAAVEALVEAGTINQHQAVVLRQQIDAGYMDEQQLVDGGVLTAAQMQAVRIRLIAVKESFASGAGSAAPAAKPGSKDPSKSN
jgi:hypothetical protein